MYFKCSQVKIPHLKYNAKLALIITPSSAGHLAGYMLRCFPSVQVNRQSFESFVCAQYVFTGFLPLMYYAISLYSK